MNFKILYLYKQISIILSTKSEQYIPSFNILFSPQILHVSVLLNIHTLLLKGVTKGNHTKNYPFHPLLLYQYHIVTTNLFSIPKLPLNNQFIKKHTNSFRST